MLCYTVYCDSASGNVHENRKKKNYKDTLIVLAHLTNAREGTKKWGYALQVNCLLFQHLGLLASW
jgi:hypothetical protein